MQTNIGYLCGLLRHKTAIQQQVRATGDKQCWLTSTEGSMQRLVAFGTVYTEATPTLMRPSPTFDNDGATTWGVNR